MSAYLLERAWVGGAVRDDVLVEVEDGRFTSVDAADADRAGARRSPRARGPDAPGPRQLPQPRLPPGAARPHPAGAAARSGPGASRCTPSAERLDPDSYFDARARRRTARWLPPGSPRVGEFHYLHHQPDGTPYDDPNAMGARAGRGGARGRDPDHPARHLLPRGRVRRRAARGGAAALLRRRRRTPGRAGPRARAERRHRRRRRGPLRARRPARAARRGRRRGPTRRCTSTSPSRSPRTRPASRRTASPRRRLLADARRSSARRTSAVHATHLTDDDIGLLGDVRARTPASARPPSATSATASARRGGCTTPARRLTLGSDSHAVIDLFEEMRAVELDERLATQQRGHWTAAELLAAATADGHASLGFADAGRIEVGRAPTWSSLDTASVRTAGTGADAAHRGLRRRRRGRRPGDGRRPLASSPAATRAEVGRELGRRDRAGCWTA